MNLHNHQLLLGCIADDFTGAGDAASFLASNGLKTLLIIWPCEKDIALEGYQAVVIALKSRSVTPEAAVEESMAALKRLREYGAKQFYFKYCSTFDSTPDGNIGPVCDAVLDTWHLPYTILCPSLPANGRVVRDSVLYVNGVPLAGSPMRNHPLNPMWDSSVARLMDCQSRYPSFALREEDYRDQNRLERRVRGLMAEHPHFYLVPDYDEESQGLLIAERFQGLSFWTGGSGLLAHFAGRQDVEDAVADVRNQSGRVRSAGRLMLAGSCSAMTQEQVKEWISSDGSAIMIRWEDVQRGSSRIEELAALYLEEPQKDILFYSSGSIGERETDMTPGSSSAIEQFLSELVTTITTRVKVERLIVAGGETSGSVIKALGYQAYHIGRSIAPGVPVLYPIEDMDMEIVLKSGNFGDREFFVHTLEEE